MWCLLSPPLFFSLAHFPMINGMINGRPQIIPLLTDYPTIGKETLLYFIRIYLRKVDLHLHGSLELFGLSQFKVKCLIILLATGISHQFVQYVRLVRGSFILLEVCIKAQTHNVLTLDLEFTNPQNCSCCNNSISITLCCVKATV